MSLSGRSQGRRIHSPGPHGSCSSERYGFDKFISRRRRHALGVSSDFVLLESKGRQRDCQHWNIEKMRTLFEPTHAATRNAPVNFRPALKLEPAPRLETGRLVGLCSAGSTTFITSGKHRRRDGVCSRDLVTYLRGVGGISGTRQAPIRRPLGAVALRETCSGTEMPPLSIAEPEWQHECNMRNHASPSNASKENVNRDLAPRIHDG
jgi:hypothetical protein